MYNLSLLYYPVEGKSSSIERSIRIDGRSHSRRPLICNSTADGITPRTASIRITRAMT